MNDAVISQPAADSLSPTIQSLASKNSLWSLWSWKKFYDFGEEQPAIWYTTGSQCTYRASIDQKNEFGTSGIQTLFAFADLTL
ncbi:hypothetical protein GCM10028819_41740 [Spirosoma humi]